jgi:hypothetical protein
MFFAKKPIEYRMSTWDKITFWFALVVAIAFIGTPTIFSLVIDGNWTSGLFVQAVWIATLVGLFRA